MRRFSFLLPLVLAATLTGCGGLGEIPQSGGAGEMDLPNNSVQIQITGDPVQEEPAETAPMVLPVDPPCRRSRRLGRPPGRWRTES